MLEKYFKCFKSHIVLLVIFLSSFELCKALSWRSMIRFMFELRLDCLLCHIGTLWAYLDCCISHEQDITHKHTWSTIITYFLFIENSIPFVAYWLIHKCGKTEYYIYSTFEQYFIIPSNYYYQCKYKLKHETLWLVEIFLKKKKIDSVGVGYCQMRIMLWS